MRYYTKAEKWCVVRVVVVDGEDEGDRETERSRNEK